MKIKKKDLRRGLAQLPINYPDPDVTPDALPGGVLDMDAELVRVELICKRLGHNEVVVRDAALADVPKYLEKLTRTLAEMEEEFAEEIASVAAYFAAHPKAHNPYRYDNIPLALFEYRQKAHAEDQKMRRRQAVRELKQQREEQRRAKMNYGRYGASAQVEEDDDEGATEAGSGHRRAGKRHDEAEDRADAVPNEHKIKYAEWMQTWCDAELIFLKLARGLHFCLWHSDKPLVQLDCAQRIADLIHCPLTVRSKVLFYGSLFRVLAREWPTIDRYRMDKYLALVRRMVYAWILLVKDVATKSPVVSAASAASATAIATSGGRSASAAAATPKGSKAAGAKRSRAGGAASKTEEHPEDEAAAAAVATAAEEDTSDLSAANSAKGVPELYIVQYCSRQPLLCSILREIFYILQVQIIPSTTSVGLTMHVCDVAFDELTKASLTVPLYVTLAAGIPLYAMSQGNFVEKRVLDSFFPPLAGGVFTTRRAAQLLVQLKKSQRTRKSGKAAAGASPVLSEEEMTQEAERLAAMDNDAVLGELAHCCQLFSVSRGTARAVRVMFSEAELVLQQSRNPESYQALTRTAQRRRIEREIEEVNETRSRVRDERAKKREEKKAEQQKAIQEKVKERKAALLETAKAKKEAKKEDTSADAAKKTRRTTKAKDEKDAEVEIDEKAIKKAILEEEKMNKRKKAPRDTKRKKNYQLTKQDLYDSGDDSDN